MKKGFLLAGIASIAVCAFADEVAVATPAKLEDVFLYSMSPNGVYVVSEGYYNLQIFNLSNGQSEIAEGEFAECGIGNVVSNNGVMVGSSDYDSAQYWKDGEWYYLDVPEEAAEGTNLANAITPDGSRICGSLWLNPISWDEDVTMIVPCVWDATEDGYGSPVKLPYPEKDIAGSAPQYVTATDISADGKVVIGQVVTSTGFMSYPILYTQDSEGEWSYTIPDAEALKDFPEYPGNGPSYPSYEDFMTEAEHDAYEEAYNAYISSGYQLEFPDYTDYMTDEELAEYEAAMAKYNEEYEEWWELFLDWSNLQAEFVAKCPFVFNSMRLSPDGKYYGGTTEVEVSSEGSWWREFHYNVWIYDIEKGTYTKYDGENDLNLTYLANEGVGLASTSVYSASNSWVLSNGSAQPMYDWMASKSPEYAEFMKENMTITYDSYEYDEDTGDYVEVEVSELMSGRAIGTPDLNVVALNVQNIWDYADDGFAYVFDLSKISAVKGMNVDNNGETIIYDLQGRRLNETVAPGIYIINGEKKVVK